MPRETTAATKGAITSASSAAFRQLDRHRDRQGTRGSASPPAGSPSNTNLCPTRINGNAGRDYGTRFYATAFHDDKLIWSAGRYRPSVKELDCIGLVVLSHTPSRIRSASAPRTGNRTSDPHIGNGGLVKVVVGDAAYGLVVRYH